MRWAVKFFGGVALLVFGGLLIYARWKLQQVKAKIEAYERSQEYLEEE